MRGPYVLRAIRKILPTSPQKTAAVCWKLETVARALSCMRCCRRRIHPLPTTARRAIERGHRHAPPVVPGRVSRICWARRSHHAMFKGGPAKKARRRRAIRTPASAVRSDVEECS